MRSDLDRAKLRTLGIRGELKIILYTKSSDFLEQKTWMMVTVMVMVKVMVIEL